MSTEPDEGSECPNCHEGKMEFPPVHGCSCHIAPPCSACTDRHLTCAVCGFEHIPPQPEMLFIPVTEGLFASFVRNAVADLGNGKRLFNYGYDSRSGSTMVWTGQCTPEVTGKDIINHFGDGTFGHRGPVISNGRFTYTQITD